MTSALDELKAIASRKYTAEEMRLFLHSGQRREDTPPAVPMTATEVLRVRGGVGGWGRWGRSPAMDSLDLINAALKKLGGADGQGQ